MTIRHSVTLGVAICGAGLAIATLPAPAGAEADGPDHFRVTGVAADDVLNMRAAPDAGAAKVGEIAPGTDGLRNLGCKGGLSFAEWQAATEAERAAAARDRWCRVSVGGVEGWVAARFLAEGAAPEPSAATAGGPVVWRLVAVNGAAAAGAAEIGFSPDGAISGTTGCNRFQGRGRMDGASLVIEGPMATTRMACPPPLDAQEGRILAVLQGRIGIAFDPLAGRLELSSGGVSLALVPSAAPEAEAEAEATTLGFSPAPGAASDYWSVLGVAGQLNIRAEADTGAPVLAQVPPGTLLRAFECRERGDRRWCEVESLDGPPVRGWAAADYLEHASSASRAGRDIFDATGRLPCAQAPGQPMGQCEFGVARDGGGSATIVVIRPDTTRRALFFEKGTFLTADTSQADGYPEYSASREGDLTIVRVGTERYEIIDAVLFGG